MIKMGLKAESILEGALIRDCRGGGGGLSVSNSFFAWFKRKVVAHRKGI